MSYTDKEKAKAAALLADGKSYRDVEEATGIPRSTLNRWRTEDPTFRAAVQSCQVELGDMAGALLAASGAELLRRLRDPDALAEVDVSTLNRVFGTAADKLIALRRIESSRVVTVEHTHGVQPVTPAEIQEHRRRILAKLDQLREQGREPALRAYLEGSSPACLPEVG